MSLKVAVMMGSASDQEKMAKATAMLKSFDIEATEHVLSAHRNPQLVSEFALGAKDAGYSAIIAGAGMAAALPGVVAAHTILPVIGVPLSGSALNGVDSLYAIAQMPRGVPVATVAVDGAANAGLLAVSILALGDKNLEKKLVAYRKEWEPKS